MSILVAALILAASALMLLMVGIADARDRAIALGTDYDEPDNR